MDRYFIFLYPDDSHLSDLLNLTVFLLNPREKWPAHVTIAGPFRNPNRFKIERDLEETIFTLGPGNFFVSGSSTVYLRVDFLNRRDVWFKPDFKGEAIPHLTLYDGKDLNFAREFYSELRKEKLYFSFFTKGFEVVKSESGQFVTTLRERVNMNCIPETEGLQLDNVLLLNPSYRIELALKALSRAKLNQTNFS